MEQENYDDNGFERWKFEIATGSCPIHSAFQLKRLLSQTGHSSTYAIRMTDI